ncbi:MAG: metal ABC transporter permease [Candidatus Moraniibacteriota bacterium]
MIADFYQYEFLSRALIAGALLGVLAPVVGQFLVVRRFSLLADTLSHVSLLGVALAVFFNFPIFLGALGSSMIGGFGMELLRRSGKVMSESILALFLSGSLAFALVLLALSNGVNINLLSYLFGSITTVTASDLATLSFLLILASIFVSVGYRKLFLLSLDEDLARASGVSAAWYNTLFILLASAVVAGSITVVGALLIGALMIVPVLAAMQWRRSFLTTLILGIGIAESSVIAGFLVSYRFDLPSGATIVLFSILGFAISYLANIRKMA